MLTTAAGLVGLATLAGSAYATPLQARDSWSDKYERCNALWEEAPKHLSALTVNLANYVDAGTTINETANGAFIPVGTDLGPFCRFSANITTSDKSSVRFEVWLPDDDVWNGNHMMVGNGGVAGFIRYDEMQVPVNKYGFAVACTATTLCASGCTYGGSLENTGHDGTSGDGSFAFNNPESQIDFGYRAVHLTTVYSKEIVKLYYGKKAELSYWNGCSSGGKQGLKEIQMFPEDYDAALVGAPAWDWSRLNGWTYYVNAIVNNPNSTGYITPPTWTPIHQEVLAQCDGLDGVVDGIITHPGRCFLDFDKFGCNGGSTVLNSTNCLQAPQLETLRNVYTNWTDPSTGEFIFPAFNIGGEFLFAASVNGIPYGPAPNYFLYQILNVTSGIVLPVDTPKLTINGVPPTEAQLIELVRTGEVTNPGNTIAGNPDLSPFFKRGGKLLHYVGGADFLIPTNTSHVYYEKVRSKLGDVSNSYRFYEVAGMGHCSGGAGAYNFGQAGQAVKSAGGDSQSSQFDAEHDAVLALRKWREEGVKPGVLIGTKYVDDDINNGVAYSRPICPWPALPVYKGGDKNKASSFKCENAY